MPRRPQRRLRLTRLFNRTTWSLWSRLARRIRSNPRRDRFLALYGPLSVFVLLTLWISALAVGFALLHWSQRERLAHPGGPPHFADDLYMSATALFAVGLGDLVPVGRIGRLLVVAETGSSVLLLSMLFSYIPTVYQSYVRRELRVTLLEAWAGAPPSATVILRRVAASGDLSHLDAFFADWERWCADLLETHLAYPAIGYFRSQHPLQSWVSALTARLDVAALVKVGIEGLPEWRAHLAFAVARRAAIDLAGILGEPSPRLDDRLPPRELATLRCELARAGLRLNQSAEADMELNALRSSYEPHVAALATRLMMPLPSGSLLDFLEVVRHLRASFVRVVDDHAASGGDFLAHVVRRPVGQPERDPLVIRELDDQLSGRAIDADHHALDDVQAGVTDVIDFDRGLLRPLHDVVHDHMPAFGEPV